MDENTPTYGLTRHPLGFLKDPIFGTTEANLAMSVNLPTDAYNFGTSPVLDSAILVLSYAGEFYGDSTLNYSIDVHQLSSNISDETSFLSNRDYAYNSAILGNRSGKLFPTTPFKILDIVDAKPDTLKKVAPQIRIKLNSAFIQNSILKLNAENLKTTDNFASAFKGLYVNINKSGSTGNGGVMFFDFAAANSNLTLYYKKQNATTSTAKDTVSVNFPITSSYGPIAASIKHDYTGTAIATQLSNPNQQYAVTYLQPLAGLRNKISFPFVASPRLALYKYDIAEKRQNLVDNSLTTSNRALDPTVFGGYFNAVKKQYIFVITSHI